MLMEKHGSKVFVDETMRIFDPLKEEVTEGWRKVRTQELDNLYSSRDVVSDVK
jgi:hypothetical protein